MPSDNVTPFRRPPPRRPVAPQQQGGMGLKTHRGKVILVHLLTIAAFVVPFVAAAFVGPQAASLIGLGIGIAAAVIAYSSRQDAMPWAATHHEQALRTMIIAYVVRTALTLPSLVVSAQFVEFWSFYNQVIFWGSIIVLLWVGLRSLIGLVLAALRRPVPNPRGWLV